MKEQLLEGNTMILAEPGEISAVILQSMLSALQENQATITTIDELVATPTDGIEVTNLIVLQSTEFPKLGTALCKFTNLQLVVATNVTLARHGMRSVQNRHPSACFKVLNTEEMLSQNALGRNVPQAVHWLRKNLSKMNVSGFNKPTVQITRLPSQNYSNGNAQVKVTHNQLFRKDRCYVIIGGMSGLGWEIVQSIAAAGAGKIVILSRGRHPNANRRKDIDDLQVQQQVQIMTLAVDITDKTSLQDAFDQIDDTFGKGVVKGIFHGGAVLQDALFTNLTEEMLRKVLLPKVLGSWNLHEVSKRYNLDYFILHSSITSTFGNTAQSNYGAGNAFMDCLAHYRVGAGLPGQVINWGPLPLGLLEHMSVREELQRHGFFCLEQHYIHEYLFKALMMDRTQITIGSFAWKEIEEHFEDATPLRTRKRFKYVIGNGTAENPLNLNMLSTGNHDLGNRDGITACVKDIAAQVLQMDVASIENSSALVFLGFDSMQAITFAKTIRDLTTYRIPIVRLLSDSTTISDIVEYILSYLQTTKDIIEIDDSTEDAILDNLQHA